MFLLPFEDIRSGEGNCNGVAFDGVDLDAAKIFEVGLDIAVKIVRHEFELANELMNCGEIFGVGNQIIDFVANNTLALVGIMKTQLGR